MPGFILLFVTSCSAKVMNVSCTMDSNIASISFPGSAPYNIICFYVIFMYAAAYIWSGSIKVSNRLQSCIQANLFRGYAQKQSYLWNLFPHFTSSPAA